MRDEEKGTVKASRTFPVLWQGSRDYVAKLKALECPRDVPWEFIAEHEAECLNNHDQTPQRLAERGGLAPGEIVAVIEAERSCAWMAPPEVSVERLKELLAAWVAERAAR